MFFQKNLPAWERTCRAVVGLIAVCLGLLYPMAEMYKWIAIGGGIIFACTGFIGFCPMCALVGRKLKSE